MGFMGKSKLTTCSTFPAAPPPKSKPRAARSVQTMTTAEPSWKSPSTNSFMLAWRPSTVMSPLYITTGSSASCSAYSTAWHEAMVLQNTIVFFAPRKSPLTICSTTAILSTLPGQSMNRCLRFGADLCSDGVSMICKSGSSSRISRITFSDMVADTTTHCFPSGFFLSGRSSLRISSPKPASKSVSASSSTRCVTPDMCMFPFSTCFTIRPGVPTTRSSGRFSACRCAANLSPPMMSSELNLA